MKITQYNICNKLIFISQIQYKNEITHEKKNQTAQIKKNYTIQCNWKWNNTNLKFQRKLYNLSNENYYN